jgi:hypothetical protein
MKTRHFEWYTKPSHSVLRILFAGGVGAVLGFQIWRLARYGFVLSLPWVGAMLIILTQLLLGLTIGAIASGKRYWLNGICLGLIFSLPITLGAIRLGLSCVPYGLAASLSGGVDGLLTALITQAVFPQSGVRPGDRFRLRYR